MSPERITGSLLLRAVLVAALTAPAAVAMASPGAGGPALVVHAPKEAFTVGDHVTVGIQARGAAGLLWGNPEIAGSGERWAVVQPPQPVQGSDPPSWTAVLAPLQVGTLELPPITVGVRKPGKPPRKLSAGGSATVKVVSVLPPGQKVKPAPLADPVGVRGFPWEWVLPIAAAVLLLLLLAWIVRRWRRRRAGEAGPEPSLSPLDELRVLVTRLAAEAGNGDVELLCDRLARGVRRFIERSTGEPAGEMTSFEIQRLARRSGWPTPVQLGFRNALELADRVRFARRAAARAELEDTLERLLAAGEALDTWLRPAEDSEGEAA